MKRRVFSALETESNQAPVLPVRRLPIERSESGYEGESARALVARILRDDQTACDQLAREYGPGILQILRRERLSNWDAADLLQDMWERAIAKIRGGELREHDKLNAFLCAIAHGLARNHKRKIDRRCTTPDTDQIEGLETPTLRPEQNVRRMQDAEVVWKVLALMKRRRDREVIERVYLYGDEKAEVCALLHIAPDRFHGIVSRAKQRFKKLLLTTAAGKEMESDHE